jgi:hypothetical protein
MVIAKTTRKALSTGFVEAFQNFGYSIVRLKETGHGGAPTKPPDAAWMPRGDGRSYGSSQDQCDPVKPLDRAKEGMSPSTTHPEPLQESGVKSRAGRSIMKEVIVRLGAEANKIRSCATSLEPRARVPGHRAHTRFREDLARSQPPTWAIPPGPPSRFRLTRPLTRQIRRLCLEGTITATYI